MRDYNAELKNRIAFIQQCLNEAKATGIVYGNSGGKDSTLVGILCKLACDNTVGLIMPCRTMRNYNEDKSHAELVAEQFGIETKVVDILPAFNEIQKAAKNVTTPTDIALANMAPRLRMTMLYTVAASENRLVAGTGNRSEGYMGYFTKWGDMACDFNPIADLTVTEIYEFLRFLKAPPCILEKPPSAGLYEGQTDEGELGITYKTIDTYLLGGTVKDKELSIIEKYHKASQHKRTMPKVYGG